MTRLRRPSTENTCPGGHDSLAAQACRRLGPARSVSKIFIKSRAWRSFAVLDGHLMLHTGWRRPCSQQPCRASCLTPTAPQPPTRTLLAKNMIKNNDLKADPVLDGHLTIGHAPWCIGSGSAAITLELETATPELSARAPGLSVRAPVFSPRTPATAPA